MVPVGYSSAVDTRAAVKEALRAADVGDDTGWLLVMAGRRHGPERLLAQLREETGGLPVYGGSVVGGISTAGSGYSGNELVLAAFPKRLGEPRIVVSESIDGAEEDAGRVIGEWLRREEVDSAMLFYDLVRREGGINVGTTLVDAIYDTLPGSNPPMLFGAGLLGDFPLTESHAFVGDACRKGVAFAIAVPGGLEAQTRVMHGCAPVSGLMTVTKAEAARIYELDDKPAAQVLRSLAGGEDIALAFSVLLGRRDPGITDPFDESGFMNRLIIDIDEADGSIGLFETDIRTGDRVQVMMRDNQMLMDSVESGVSESLGVLGDAPLELAMYIDCAGRASVFTGSEKEEAQVLVDVLGHDAPLFGFYAGREIAPIGGRARPLDWTGVLVTFVERSAS